LGGLLNQIHIKEESKEMKKFLLVLVALTVVLGIAACKAAPSNSDKTDGPSPTPTATQNPNKDSSGNLTDSLEEILKKIYDTANTSKVFKDSAKDGLKTEQIKTERVKYFLGKEGLEFESAIASEFEMGGAYSLCLVRVKKGADVEQIKKDIKENVDPFKWVCMGVDEKNIYVDNIGDVVCLVMSNDEGKNLHEAFLALGK
jgi:hypothetical protein